jgi:GNAT superfamily N-acetyltransferase
VGLLGDQVAGTATARLLDRPTGEGTRPGSGSGAGEVLLDVEVLPALGSRGVGTALLATATAAFGGATALHAVGTDGPVALAFALRHGFVPVGEHSISVVSTATVAAGVPPHGLRAITLDCLPDLEMLLEAYNLAAVDDPSGMSRPMTMSELRTDWRSPDNAPDLSWGLVADEPPGAELVAFTSVQVDRERGRSWSSMTATRPTYRGRGLARWLKQRMLGALHQAGLSEAWTANDSTNAAMLAVNASLGYRPAATSVRLARRLTGG